MGTVRWLTAFVDIAAARHDATVRFWRAATGSDLSPARGQFDEFATLVPPDGDAYLRVQRVREGDGGIHLDVHVDDVTVAADAAVEFGATVVHRAGHAVMRSPAGFVFCVVPHHDEPVRPAPVVGPDDATSLVDQLCIDVPTARFDDECAFWAALAGWELRSGALAEFAVLVRPPSQPLRVLLQRLGPDDGGDVARAHLDLACGVHVDAVTAWHERLGATVVRRERYWTTLSDPAGFAYCLTARDPVSGALG